MGRRFASARLAPLGHFLLKHTRLGRILNIKDGKRAKRDILGIVIEQAQVQLLYFTTSIP